MKKVLLIVLLMCSGCQINKPQEGKKTGVIVKLAEEGFISKTWEGELIRGGLVDGSGAMGGSFKFTVENRNDLSDALRAFEGQREVILHYRTEFVSCIFRSECGEPHFVTKIEIK